MKTECNPEAYHLGYHRGAEIGAELGYYCGFLERFIEEDNLPSDKAKIAVKNVIELIEGFPKENADNVDILNLLEQIRGRFKKACALLKVNAVYSEKDNLSF